MLKDRELISSTAFCDEDSNSAPIDAVKTSENCPHQLVWTCPRLVLQCSSFNKVGKDSHCNKPRIGT